MIAAWIRRTGRAARERHGRDPLGVDEHVEPVGQRDPATGGDERLRLHRLVAVTGVPDPARRGERAFARLSRRLLLIALIAFCAFLLDAAAYNWSAVHLRTDHGAAPGLAAVAFTLFSLTWPSGACSATASWRASGGRASCRGAVPWRRRAAPSPSPHPPAR